MGGLGVTLKVTKTMRYYKRMHFAYKPRVRQAATHAQKSVGFGVVEFIVLLVIFAGLVLVGWQVLRHIGAAVKAKTDSAGKSAQVVELKGAKGFSLSPKTFGPADYSAFFGQAVDNGSSAITWAGGWTELEKTSGAPYTVMQMAKKHNYQPIIIVGTHHDVAGVSQPLEPLNADNQQRFVSALTAFAKTYQPAYLGIGNEVNRIYGSKPADYAAFTQWFAQAAAAVKQASPNTKVFVIFQYEQLNGLYGGLFGGKNNEADTTWQLLDDFPTADLIAFTTYPYLIYKDPADIPADYYTRAKDHTAKATAFTEVGWPSGTEAPGYESSNDEQAAFVARFGTLVSPSNPAFVIWSFLYDQGTPKPFSSIGLIGRDGTAKPALQVWQRLAP